MSELDRQLELAQQMEPRTRLGIYLMYKAQAESTLQKLEPLIQDTLAMMYQAGEREIDDESHITYVETTRRKIDNDALYNGHRDIYTTLAESGKLEVPTKLAKTLIAEYGEMPDVITSNTTSCYQIRKRRT